MLCTKLCKLMQLNNAMATVTLNVFGIVNLWTHVRLRNWSGIGWLANGHDFMLKFSLFFCLKYPWLVRSFIAFLRLFVNTTAFISLEWWKMVAVCIRVDFCTVFVAKLKLIGYFARLVALLLLLLFWHINLQYTRAMWVCVCFFGCWFALVMSIWFCEFKYVWYVPLCLIAFREKSLVGFRLCFCCCFFVSSIFYLILTHSLGFGFDFGFSFRFFF